MGFKSQGSGAMASMSNSMMVKLSRQNQNAPVDLDLPKNEVVRRKMGPVLGVDSISNSCNSVFVV